MWEVISQVCLWYWRKNFVLWTTAFDSSRMLGNKQVMFGWRVTDPIKKHSITFSRKGERPSKTANEVEPREQQNNGINVWSIGQ